MALDLQLTVVSSDPCNMAIFLFFKMAAAAIMDFKFYILTVGTVKSAKLRHRTNFCRNRSNRDRNITILIF